MKALLIVFALLPNGQLTVMKPVGMLSMVECEEFVEDLRVDARKPQLPGYSEWQYNCIEVQPNGQPV